MLQYNLPLSRAKLWVVSQLCCRTLHPLRDPDEYEYEYESLYDATVRHCFFNPLRQGGEQA